jgi:hypothetical protein
MKFVNACISAARELRAAAEQPTNAGLNALNASPRQRIVPSRARPVAAPVHRAAARHAAQRLRRHRPFIGWNSQFGHGIPAEAAVLKSGPASRRTQAERVVVRLDRGSSGFARSHARLSKSPKMWQLAHAQSPWAEVLRAS